ncbi:MAG: isoaspartyl peptidase/L-asparaginase [Owenweeksia sp.]|nr:isoaspartyl peptidase/L-asparaginase [Owenweeksia sp.]
MSRGKFVLAIHGGVGTILKENMLPAKEKAYREALNEALTAGSEILKRSGSSIDAVEAASMVLEDSPLFNAGRGSVFTHEGKNEMDASIMDGKTLNAGAVAGVSRIKNPVSAARAIMEKSPHIMLMGVGAEKFAAEQMLPLMEPAYFYDEERYRQLMLAQKQDQVLLDHSGENKRLEGNIENGGKKLGTVGAVALDLHGNLAAATSTGGMTNKKFGRMGDSPVIGAGTYANNKTCAVSGTGHGEFFIRNVVAYDISALMEYKGFSLKEAADLLIFDKLKNQGGEAGVVALDRSGKYVMTFNTEGMYRGVVKNDQPQIVEIYR